MLYQKYDQKHINEDYLIDTQPKHLQQYYSPISIIRRPLKKKNTHKEEKSTNGEQSIEKILHSL